MSKSADRCRQGRTRPGAQGLDETTARFAALSQASREHAAAARSESTTRAYDSDWRHFSAWCARYGQEPLPAAPQTVANYLTDHAPGWRDATEAELARGSRRVVDGRVRAGARPATLRRRLAAIGVIHRAAGHDNPAAHQLVRDVLDGIARTPAAGGRRQAAAATADPVVTMLAAMNPAVDPRDARDAAVLLLGMTGPCAALSSPRCVSATWSPIAPRAWRSPCGDRRPTSTAAAT